MSLVMVEPEVPFIDLSESTVEPSNDTAQSSSNQYDQIEMICEPGVPFPKPFIEYIRSPTQYLTVPETPVNSTIVKPAAKAKKVAKEEKKEKENPLDTTVLMCPICLDSVRKNNPHSTTCGHIFCKSCIKQVIATSQRCPMCKKTLYLAQIHPIFL
jgi:hypothetical protein